MEKLSAEQKYDLAYKILDLLKEYEINTDVCIYFDDKRLSGTGKLTENIKASDYFDYANDSTLSMSFEGDCYEIMNYNYPSMSEEIIQKFNTILDSYGLCYEMGNSWNLACYYSDPDLWEEPEEIIKGEIEKCPIYIYGSGGCPTELKPIRAEWERRTNEYGDVGSCVLGAGFTFRFKNVWYKMPPQGHTQGSISWEHCLEDIQGMLTNIGCEELKYDWGRMD